VQRRGKKGSGAKPVPEEAIPEGLRHVNRRAAAGGSAHTVVASKGRRP
jgi:hypothetical protein